jgi:hypothetical protein
MVTAPQPGQIPGEADPTLATQGVQPFVSPNTLARSPVSQAASFASNQQANSNRLNAYLLRHNQMARTAGRQGFVSFVPIVATQRAAVTEGSEPDIENAQAGSEPVNSENK